MICANWREALHQVAVRIEYFQRQSGVRHRPHVPNHGAARELISPGRTNMTTPFVARAPHLFRP
jgi:hypothetical protein